MDHLITLTYKGLIQDIIMQMSEVNDKENLWRKKRNLERNLH